ncbi:MAG: redoxin domain-containing protein [Gemmatimonadota bacterium]
MDIGRFVVSAAIFTAWLAGACAGERPDGRVGRPYPAYVPPRVAEAGEFPLIEWITPRESLFVYEEPPAEGLALVFYRGRGVPRDSAGNAYLPQESAGRILVVGPDLSVVRTIGGPSEERGGVGLPLSVAATRGGATFLIDVEHPEGLLYFDERGRYRGSSEPPLINGSLSAAPDGALWTARSPYILGFDPTPPGEPLLYRFDPLRGEGAAIAEIEPVTHAELNRLANAGAVAAGPDGSGYFAFLLRNELRAYRSDGRLAWRVTRSLSLPPMEPTFAADDGGRTLRVRPVTQALAIGPDELLYALTASDSLPGSSSGPPVGHRRVEVYDPADGTLLRATTVPAGWTSFGVDDAGRVYRVDDAAIVNSAPPPERRSLPGLVLEGFGGDSVTFADYRGRALLINVWASWCVPCRAELPRLKALYERLDRGRVEFLAISDDEDEEAARGFAASLDLPFPLFLGRGKMQDHFRFPGLPYTVLADYRGRVVEEFFGFGSEASWKRLTETLAAEIERAAPAHGGDALEPSAHRHDGMVPSGRE